MQIAGYIEDSIVDGPGLRFVVFTQGCSFMCKGCHNPETWDFDGGAKKSVKELTEKMLSNPLTDGLTLSGGEPFNQAREASLLAQAAHKNGLNVWVFSGYTFEELLEKSKIDENVFNLLQNIDILVDGRYIEEQRTLNVKWCQSKNQRIIDVAKSLEKSNAVLHNV